MRILPTPKLTRNSEEIKYLRKCIINTTGRKGTGYGLTYNQKEHGAHLAYIQSLFQHFRQNRRIDLMINLGREMTNFQERLWNDHQRSGFDGDVFTGNMIPDKIQKTENIQTADGIIIQNLILAGYSSKYVNWIAIGTGTDDPSPGQTQLSNEITRLPCLKEGWMVPAADVLQTGIIFGAGTPTNKYSEFGGVTGGDAVEDFLGWRILMPVEGYIDHRIGETIILFNHIQETVSIS